MAIWMDLTGNFNTDQKVPFEVAFAQRELAKVMADSAPDVRFFRYDGFQFTEVGNAQAAALTESAGTAESEEQDSGTKDVQAEEGENLQERYPLLKNAYSYSTSRLLRLVWGLLLYADTLPKGISSVVKGVIRVVSWPLKKASLFRAHRKDRKARKAHQAQAEHEKRRAAADTGRVAHPFGDGDLVFSAGWFNSGKEAAFESVKKELPRLRLAYLVYDIAPIHPDTEYLCPKILSENFYNYIKWICFHCDLVLFTDETTQMGMEAYQREHNLPMPEAVSVGAGPFARDAGGICFDALAKKRNINGDYILAVGPLKKWNNYSTLYRAMTVLAEKAPETCPQLVIVGEDSDHDDLVDTMKRDPRTKTRIVQLPPRADELDALYRNAVLVAAPAVGEGARFSAVTALNYGKTVLAADTQANRRVCGELANYVDPFDPFAWAEEIMRLCGDGEARSRQEETSAAQWQKPTWESCAQAVLDACRRREAACEESYEPKLYMDITLTWNLAHFGGRLTGIPRAELMLMKHLFRLKPDMKFFGINDVWGYQEIDAAAIDEILIGTELDAAFEACRKKLQAIGPRKGAAAADDGTLQGKEHAYWFLVSLFSPKWQEKLIAYGKKRKMKMKGASVQTKTDGSGGAIYDVPFRPGDVVFTAGTGSGDPTHDKLLRTKQANGYKYCAVIYDYTTILLPQVHQLATIEYYDPFLKFTSEMSDLILYGGETARTDGIAHQIANGYPQPASHAIKFGSDISKKKGERDPEEEQKILERLGITGPFVMMVGTMEVRKNHETVYRAYLRMMEEYSDIPQLVFAGHPGWKTGDFLETLRRDERVAGKILQLSPTDEELDVLYQNCEFTVLASLYEGWSLTLPESFWYGKFCLCCDTPALKETARDLTEYIHGWDEKKWAERIYYYHTHPEELAAREQRIAEEWHPISWAECAQQVMGHLENLCNGEMQG